MLQDTITLLQGLPIFGGINTATVQLLLELSKPVSKKKGELFFGEGEPGSSMFVLQKGTASVVKLRENDEYLIRTVRKGDCFGEMAVMDYFPRCASVKAEEESCAIEISTMDLLEVYKQNLEQFTMIQMNMGREVSRRLREASDQLFEYKKGELKTNKP